MTHRFAQPEVLSEAEGTNNATMSVGTVIKSKFLI